MTERNKSTYELVRKDPPVVRRGRGSGKVYEVLDKLAADASGEWFVIAECKSRPGANSVLTSIRSGNRVLPHPVEFYEFTTRTYSDTDTSELYARWLGEEGAKAAAEAAERAAAEAANADAAPAPEKRRPGRPRKNPA